MGARGWLVWRGAKVLLSSFFRFERQAVCRTKTLFDRVERGTEERGTKHDTIGKHHQLDSSRESVLGAVVFSLTFCCFSRERLLVAFFCSRGLPFFVAPDTLLDLQRQQSAPSLETRVPTIVLEEVQ